MGSISGRFRASYAALHWWRRRVAQREGPPNSARDARSAICGRAPREVSTLGGVTRVLIAWNYTAITAAGDRAAVAWRLRTADQPRVSPTAEAADPLRVHSSFGYGRPLRAATARPLRATDKRSRIRRRGCRTD